MSRTKIDRPGTFLSEHGILFEINRQVLHPLGLELALELDSEGGVCAIELVDNRANPDPIYFTPEGFEEGRTAFEAYLREHGRRNMQKRRQMGMVIQTGPNLPRHIHGESADGGDDA